MRRGRTRSDPAPATQIAAASPRKDHLHLKAQLGAPRGDLSGEPRGNAFVLAVAEGTGPPVDLAKRLGIGLRAVEGAYDRRVAT